MIKFDGVIGFSGGREVFMGFASASLLHKMSFADVLDEATGLGYQRRFNDKHSLDFRIYIQQGGSTTIPLTFNLRPRIDNGWSLKRKAGGAAVLLIKDEVTDALSQVDCQHRLGYLADVDVQMAFMSFIGLTPKEEMEVFSVINGKAKGLSSSLLDFHEAKLAGDLAKQAPHLYIAFKLNEDTNSPWYKRLDLGGKQKSGMTRRASLRTMQKAIKRFLHETRAYENSPDETYNHILNFWNAITLLLPEEWENHRKHFITKGIGVYALSSIAADIYIEAESQGEDCNYNYYVTALSKFINDIDWSSGGLLKGLGGEAGVNEAVSILRSIKNTIQLELISNA